jgi:hypothetical protein
MTVEIPRDADLASSRFEAARQAAAMDSKVRDVKAIDAVAAIGEMINNATTSGATISEATIIGADHLDMGKANRGRASLVGDHRKAETPDVTTGKTPRPLRRWNCRSARLRDKSRWPR